MPRRPRAFADGIFHFSAHGSDTRQLFLRDEDREDFLTRLAAVCEAFELALVSYVLMDNHYHAILRIPDERVSSALQRLHAEYARHHNRRYRRRAHLFRAHPLARELTSDGDLAGVCRYLARNPVRAMLVRDALAYRWSSARAHAGIEAPHVPLAESDLRAAYGGTPNWRSRYREYISIDEGSPHEAGFTE